MIVKRLCDTITMVNSHSQAETHYETSNYHSMTSTTDIGLWSLGNQIGPKYMFDAVVKHINNLSNDVDVFYSSSDVPTGLQLKFNMFDETSGWLSHRTRENEHFDTNVSVAQDNDSLAKVMTAAHLLWAYKVGECLQTYWIPIVLPIGLIGNILSIIVTLQRNNRKISCCVYMAGLAVSDTIVLCVFAYYWAATDILKRPIHLIECKILAWMFQTFTVYGVYVIVFMTLDRCLVVKWPLRAVTWCAPRRAKRTLAILLLVVLVYCVPSVFYAGVVDNGSYCASFAVNTQWSRTLSWVTTGLNSVIPFFIILTINYTIIITFHRKAKFRDNMKSVKLQRLSKNCKKRNQNDKDVPHIKGTNCRERQLISMLLLVTFALLILTLPQYIRYAVYLFVDCTTSAHKYALYILIYNLTNKLHFTNSAINLFLYCIGGSKFRKDLTHLCKCRKRRNSLHSYEKSLSVTDKTRKTVPICKN